MTLQFKPITSTKRIDNGEILNQALNKVNTVHMQCLHELEVYAYYIARCLQEKFNLKDIVLVSFDEPKGIRQAVVYPKSSVINGEGVVNPLFFFGYKLTIEKDGIHLLFSEEIEKIQ